MSCLRFAAKPALAEAAKRPDIIPQKSENRAMHRRIAPYLSRSVMFSELIWSIRDAITSGIMHSMDTSPTMKSGVRTASFLYSLMLLARVFIIVNNLLKNGLRVYIIQA